MSLSRKHFQALADIVRAAYVPENGEETANVGYNLAVSDMADALADFCAQHNPNFDRARFLDACQPKPSKE